MTKEYVDIKKEIYGKRMDFTFFPAELNKMTDDERKEIDELLVKCCINGVKSSYKYIPYIKMIDPNVIIVSDNFKKLPLIEQLTIITNLYIYCGKQEYFDVVAHAAVSNSDAYSLLVDMYVCCKKKGMDISNIYNKLKEIAEINSNNAYYTVMFQRRDKR